MDKQKMWAVFCGVFAIIFVGILFIGNGKLGDLRIEEAKNRSEISEINSELAQLKEELDYVPQVKLDETEQEEISHSAAELGDLVAQYQNTYATLNAVENRDAFQANVDALDACFTEGSKAARVPWYSGGRPGNWTFITDGKFKGVNKEVLWLCQSPEDGSLLAYATALYDSEANRFGDVNFQMSLLGSHSVESSGEAPEEPIIDQEQINQMTEQIQQVETPQERELTAEEIEDVKSAQQQLKELMTKEQEDDANEN